MKIDIYQMASGNFSSATVKLLEKIYTSGKRCIFFSPIAARVDLINKTLWTFSTNAFIPHGDNKMKFAEQQPIYFTSVFENPNNASVLVLADIFDLSNDFYQNFERIILIFEDASKAEEVNELYHTLKNSGKNVNYWKQSLKGWENLN